LLGFQRLEARPTKIILIPPKDQRFIRYSDDVPGDNLVSMGFYQDLSDDALSPIRMNLSDEAADILFSPQWVRSRSATKGQHHQYCEQSGQYEQSVGLHQAPPRRVPET
jgi:hypothetical protein